MWFIVLNDAVKEERSPEYSLGNDIAFVEVRGPAAAGIMIYLRAQERGSRVAVSQRRSGERSVLRHALVISRCGG